MKFKLEIQMDNAAFEQNEPAEVARILREIAGQVTKRFARLVPLAGGSARDENGNRVATWTVE